MARDCTALDDAVGKPPVARGLERLASCGEDHAHQLARGPGVYEVVTVGREEQVDVVGREDGLTGRGIEIGAGHSNPLLSALD